MLVWLELEIRSDENGRGSLSIISREIETKENGENELRSNNIQWFISNT